MNSKQFALAPLRYALALWIASMSWVFWYLPRTPEPLMAGMSLALQFATIGMIYVWLDVVLAKRRGTQFILAGTMALLAALVIVDTILLVVTSASLRQSLSMMVNTGDVWSALTESVMSRGHVALLACGAGVVFLAGGAAHRVLPKRAIRRPRHHLLAATCLVLLGVFISEQLIAQSCSGYLLRSTALPMYARISSQPPASSYTVAIPPPASAQRRLEWLMQVKPPDKPLNIVYILLESVRADAIDESIAPNIHALRETSVHYVDAQANAILTLLSWNQILFDRPPYTMADDVRATRSDPLGAWPLEVLHAAGYSVRLSIADDIRLYDYDRRLVGERGTVQELFIADQPGRSAGHLEDAAATDRAIHWITQSPDQPFFILLELASTHWTYAFDESRAIVRPFAESVHPLTVRSQTSLDLLRNRYLNALHQVDEQVGRVTHALRECGLDSRTVIVVTSDHGEGFVMGRAGHAILHNDTRHVPMMFSMPHMRQLGSDVQGNATIHAGSVRGVTSHSAIWPTLFSLVGLRGVHEGMLTGRIAFGLDMDHGAALSFDGGLEYASLTLPQYVVEFKVQESPGTLTFSPIGVSNRQGNPIQPLDAVLRAIAWQKTIHCIMTDTECADVGLLQHDEGRTGR